MMYEEFFSRNNFRLIKKNETTSTQNRLEGNQLMKTDGKLDSKLQINILAKYNESIAFAPLNSQELALAYGNRSFLTFYLAKYEESIIDINRALLIPECLLTFKAKLLIRKGQCLAAIDDQKTADEVFVEANKIINKLQNPEKEHFLKLLISRKALPKKKKILKIQFPQFARSKEVPCMSNVISLKFNQIYGRHLVANQDIMTGKFLMIEEAYTVAPEQNKIYILCSFCLCPAWTGVPCSSCVFAVYCSEECRQKAWIKYHNVECFVTTLLNSNIDYFNLSFAALSQLNYRLRLLITASKEKSGNSMDFSYLLDEFKKLSNCNDKCATDTKNNQNAKFLFDKFAGFMTLIGSNDKCITLDMMFRNVFIEVFDYLCEVEIITPQQKHLIHQNIATFADLLFKMSQIISNNSYRFDAFECNCGVQYGSGDLYHQGYCVAERGSIIGCASSLVNHSCLNNVERLFECGKIVLFANRPIKKDEQLFCCYGPKFQQMKKPERQMILKSRYNFYCQCEACDESWPTLSSKDIQKSRELLGLWMRLAHKYKDDSDHILFMKWKNQKSVMQDLGLMIDKVLLKHSKLNAETLASAEDLINMFGVMYSNNYTTTFDVDE